MQRAQTAPPGALAAGAAQVPVEQRDRVADFLNGPILVSMTASAGAKALPTPSAMKLLEFAVPAAEARVILLPPPSDAAPCPAHLVVRTATSRQWGRLAPTAPGELPAVLASAEDVARARCSSAALLSLGRAQAAVQEASAACAGVLAACKGEGAAPSLPAALASFLLLLAEALRGAGSWREAVFTSHGLLRILTGAANPDASDESGAEAGTGTFVSSEAFSDAPAAPVAEQALAFLQRGKVFPPSHLPRVVCAAAMSTAETLSGVGYQSAAANALASGATALTALCAAAGEGDLAMAEAGERAGFALRCASAARPWLWTGVLLTAQVALARSRSNDGDGAAAAAALEGLHGWRQGIALLPPLTAEPTPLSASILESAPLGAQYVGAVVGVQRASALLSAGKLTEATATAETAVALAAYVVRSACAPVVAADESLDASAVLGGYGDAGVAAACLMSAGPDPSDTLASALCVLAECLKRGRPIPAGPGGGAPIMPTAIAAGLLECAIRASPSLLVREVVVSALTTLYDSGRDPSSAQLAKSTLRGVAGRFGLSVDERAFHLI